MKPLTDQQRRFVDEYMVDMNATQAAIRAGYSPRTTGLYTAVLKRPHIRAAVDAAIAERGERTKVTADLVVRELARIAFANPLDYLSIGEDGLPKVDLSAVRRDQAAGLSRISIEYFRDSDGRATGAVRKVSVSLADKRAALVDLGKHLGIFRERLEITGAGQGPLMIVTGVPRDGDQIPPVLTP